MKKIKLICLAAVILMLVILSGCSGTGNGGNRDLTMPDVTGMSRKQALQTLERTGFSDVSTNVDEADTSQAWTVTAQNIEAGTQTASDTPVFLTCNKKCSLYLDVKSASNLVFAKYDIDVRLDGASVGTIANGGYFTYLAKLWDGEHELSFFRKDNESVSVSYTVELDGDMTFSCRVEHGARIELADIATEDNVSGSAIKMPDVTGMILAEGKTVLQEAGFVNVREEPYADIWDDENWRITRQNIPAGSRVDKNTYIQLDCLSLDDFYNFFFTGKDMAEIATMSENLPYTYVITDTSDNDIAESFSQMTPLELKSWVVVRARQYKAEKNIVLLVVEKSDKIH